MSTEPLRRVERMPAGCLHGSGLMNFLHLAARTRYGFTPFGNSKACAWMWSVLRGAFPSSIASTLMPDHLHVLAEGPPDELRLRLSYALRNFTRRFYPEKRIWEPVSAPKVIPNAKHLLRQIRYVHLNPCRDGLVHDPLVWEWSTHRDWTGFVARPWPDLDRAARILGWSRRGMEEKIHAYVSADPTVNVSGTRLRTDPPRGWEARIMSPELVRSAVEIAHRAHAGSATRKGALRSHALRFALRHSGISAGEVARLFEVTPQTVWKHAQKAVDRSEDVLLRILRDDRLLSRKL